MGSKPIPSIIDPRSSGGVPAIDGFDFQFWYAVLQIPRWLANPRFEQLIVEGIEDVEARFFAPQTPRGHLLERFQVKGGALDKSEVYEVFQNFQHFEQAHPQAARLHSLIARRLPEKLLWLARDPDRVRTARPFYAPFPSIVSAGDAALNAKFTKHFGENLGLFASQSVDVVVQGLSTRDEVQARFATELKRRFPLITVSYEKREAGFDALEQHLRKTLRYPVNRSALVQVLENAIGCTLPVATPVPIRILSDPNSSDETSLEIDAMAFSGGQQSFPSANEWDALRNAFASTANWLKANHLSRAAILGTYRLTTAFVIGNSLRSANGFELDVHTKDGVWSTDNRPPRAHCASEWSIEEAQELVDGELIVSVGVLRNPWESISSDSKLHNASLRLYLARPVESATDAQTCVGEIKRAIDVVCARLKPSGIKLFYAGPASLALMLGHRWNALPPTQLHEFIAVNGSYVPTARI